MKNKVENKDSKTMVDVLTGAVKGATVVGLSALIVGSCAFRIASIECNVNHSAETICPITRLETFLFGVEAGMQHQAHDLESYKISYPDHVEYTSNVEYLSEGETPSVAFDYVEDYGDMTESARQMWTYVDGEFIKVNAEENTMSKGLSK